VTVTGTSFTGATKVLFGAVAATSFSVTSDTKITAVSPAQAAATHNIYVTTPVGTSAPVTADQFTYT
jgi:IPT/TIG domain